MFDVVNMPFNWPVELNYHEAKAYCAWKSKKDNSDYRVLSEAEHHAIRDNDKFSLQTKDDIIYQERSDINHNFAYGSSTVSQFQNKKKIFFTFLICVSACQLLPIEQERLQRCFR
jgi:formylglycine-generating enzyme required for sulfatase activity